MGDIHQKIQAEFVIVQPVHVFLKKALVQPERADDPGGNPQFLCQLPQDSLLGCLAHLNTAAGQVEIGGTLIPHRQDLSLMQNYGAGPVVEFCVSALKRNIHIPYLAVNRKGPQGGAPAKVCKAKFRGEVRSDAGMKKASVSRPRLLHGPKSATNWCRWWGSNPHAVARNGF